MSPTEPEPLPETETSAPAAPIAAPPRPAPAEPNLAACAQRLKEISPALFGGAPKPLKLRIQVDIQQRAPGVFTKSALSAFFRRHTGSTAYLLAVANGQQRFDLDGQPAGEIADEHRKAARDELARRRANHEGRRALEAQQRHNRAGLLYDWERTTLTRANFCALKQVAEAELDGLLAIAREEAAQPRGPAPRPRPDGAHRQQPPRGGRG
jgi:ProP effector